MTVPSSTTAPLTIRLLGPMQVMVGNQSFPHVRSRKALWLLALLVLRSDRPVEREWVSGMLWPDIDASRAASNLRVVLSELRHALGDEGHRLQSPRRHTLAFDLTGADVDVVTFDQAILSQNPAALAEAVSLHRRPLLEDCPEEWVLQERIARERNCLQALQTLADSALSASDPEAATAYYRRAMALDPLSEAALRGLMQALFRSGDINAALNAYQSFARLLRRDNPKAAPDPKTNALYTRLRTEAKRQAARSTSVQVDGAGTSPTPAVTGYLPNPLTDLIGRDDERLDVAARLRRSRLVTLTGPGGIGKTRLAVGVAGDIRDEYPDGAWLVALESLSEGARLTDQIAEILQVKPTPGRTLRESLTDHLRPKRLLLILDNCEHLREPTASLALHLLRECPDIRILATSREILGIAGEAAWAVPGLAVPDLSAHLPTGSTTLVRVLSAYESIQLFVERAQEAQNTFSLTGENALTVAQICVRLEGIPLAIELAAARVRVLTVEQINARLDNHLALLTGGSRLVVPRHQTLRATLDWSYELLSDEERRVLERMSIFAGGCDLEAAESICADEATRPEQILDRLTSLVDKSLVVFEKEPQDAKGRYRLLETVRQYAAEHLAASGELDAVRDRHRNYFLTFAEAAEPKLSGDEQAFWLRRFRTEHDNLRAALAAYDSDPAGSEEQLRLVIALSSFWTIQGYRQEGRRLQERALARTTKEARTFLRAKALAAAGKLAKADNDYAAAQTLYEESLALFEEQGNRSEAAPILSVMGNMRLLKGDLAAAAELLGRSLALSRELGDKPGTARVLADLGILRNQQSDFLSAHIYYEESLTLFEEIGNRRYAALLLTCLGNNCAVLSQNDRAQSYFERSLAIFEEIGDRENVATVFHLQGTVAGNAGDYKGSLPYLERSAAIHREIGSRRALAWSLANLGFTRKLCGDPQFARATIEESLAIFEEIGEQRGIMGACSYLGEVVYSLGDVDAAQAYFTRSLTLCREAQDRATVAMNLGGMASVLLTRQQPARAGKLLAAATALRSHIGAPLPSHEQAEFDALVAQASAASDSAIFAAAWAEGSALDWEEAITCALE